MKINVTLAVPNQGRLDAIIGLIEASDLSIHDLSRVELSRGIPRFNMPLELGQYLGGSRPRGATQRGLSPHPHAPTRHCSRPLHNRTLNHRRCNLSAQDTQPSHRLSCRYQTLCRLPKTWARMQNCERIALPPDPEVRQHCRLRSGELRAVHAG